MTRPNKLESLTDLKRHIDEFAAEHDTGFKYDIFEISMDMELSALKMTKMAKCNYRTMRKWRALYKELSV